MAAKTLLDAIESLSCSGEICLALENALRTCMQLCRAVISIRILNRADEVRQTREAALSAVWTGRNSKNLNFFAMQTT
jgi:hypothetical protein